MSGFSSGEMLSAVRVDAGQLGRNSRVTIIRSENRSDPPHGSAIPLRQYWLCCPRSIVVARKRGECEIADSILVALDVRDGPL